MKKNMDDLTIITPAFTGQRRPPQTLPDEYIHIDDKQDEFDWNLTKVRVSLTK